jgi:hypothetical protein
MLRIANLMPRFVWLTNANRGRYLRNRGFDAPLGGTFSRVKERCARGFVAAAAVAALLATAGCGGERQDANEPEGQFKVNVTDASFPATQSNAQPARMKIEVRNDDKRTLPSGATSEPA